MSDIRKWFVKAQCKNNDKAAELTKQAQPEKGSKEGSGRRKTSKYFAEKPRSKDEKDTEQTPTKRKSQKVKEEPPSKKLHSETAYGDADCALPNLKKNSVAVTSNKNLGSGSVGGVVQKCANTDDIDEENEIKDTEIVLRSDGRGRGRSASTSAGGRGKGGGHSALAADADEVEENNIEDIDEEAPTRSGGVGRGGKNTSAAPAGGRGRGGRGGGFMNFGERKPPPHKGEKEVPEGASDCLSGLTFVLSGTLDSLEREEAVDLIKRHGGRVTGSVSKKTNYLLCDEDIGGRKSSDAKRLGTRFLTEDGLFDMIRASNHTEGPTKENLKKTADQVSAALPKTSVQNAEINKVHPGTSSVKAPKGSVLGVSHTERKGKDRGSTFLTWTDKYRPKVPNEIVGNQSLVKQLHDWLAHWRENFLDSGNKAKRKGQNGSGVKKAVLLSGTPGIGKTTSAKLVSQMLGFQLIEVNASDSRGKADIHIRKGIGGSTANSMKELVSNEALSLKKDWSKDPKTVLIMDEVDGMSAGDRGGVADLIASIKISKIPIICICNDRYSQKLKSLVNYCMPLNFRKPTKQQMAKRLCHIAKAEGLQVNEIALEELAERVNGDMRMALNHLQYMSLSMSVIKYDDVRHRLFSSSKDEDISPFTAVNKLFSFDGGKLRMDERIDLSTSDADLVPLLIQENYVNYRPSLAGKDENGVKHMSLIASAAESIADGDIINVKIRRHRQWQLFQNASVSSCIIPAALMHGQRQILEQGENNYNRFGGWLGKNSTMGKNIRLLEDLNFHFVASCASNMGRGTLRLDYLNLLLKHLTNPLRELPKDEAVQRVMEMRNFYSITPEDYDTIVELSKFPGLPNPADGIPTAVKTALTKAYKQRKLRTRVAEDIALPGVKKAPKKRVAAILEPAAGGAAEEEGDVMAETDEEKASDTDDLDETMNGEKLESDLRSLNSKGIQVQVDLKAKENASAKKTPTGRGRGRGSTDAAEKKAGRGSGGSAAKRKR